MEFEGREILIGVTGGIAAYKSAMLVSRLVSSGAGVSVIMTEAATHLIGPRTFEALTNRPVGVSMWESATSHPHIDLARSADILCIAPATADIIAKAACGIADDLLSTVYLAFEGQVLMAPAMNCVMWSKPVVQRNCRQLAEDGVHFVGPDSGRLSCGESGVGRMAEPEEILNAIGNILSRS